MYTASVTWEDKKKKSILNENFNMAGKFFSIIFLIHPRLSF